MLNSIINIDSELGGIVLTVIFVFFLLGAVILFVVGLISMADAYGSKPSNSKFGAWGKIIAAGLLASLGEFLTSADKTIFGSGAAPGSLGAQASGSSSTATCSISAATAESGSMAACALNNLKAVAPYALHLLFVVSLVSGVLIVGSTLWSMSHEWAQQTHNRRLPWAKLMLGAALTSPGFLLNMIEATFGMQNAVVGTGGFSAASAYLAYVPPEDSVINKLGGNWSAVITASLTIFAFFGALYAIQGFFILLKASDHHGARDASFGKAATHIIGGILMANMGWTLPAIGTMVFGSNNNLF